MSRILIIEDDSSVAEMMVMTLQHDNHEVITLPSASGAAETISEQNIELAIVDIVLPGQGGMELVLDLHGKFPALPLILTSGKIDTSKETFRVLAKQFGVLSILAKPFTVEELLQSVKHALS